MGRPREHNESTRQSLLQAAERLVADHGYDALSVRAVADAVGTTTRAVYSLFGSKVGLLEALGVRLFRELAAAVDGVPSTDDPVADVVVAAVDGFRQVAREHPALYSMVFLRVDPQATPGRDYVQAAGETFARLEALMVRVEQAHGLGGRTAAEAAQTVHALTEGLATIELRGGMGSEKSARAVWRDAVGALVVGLTHSSSQPTSG